MASPRREEPVYRGEIKNQRKSVLKLIKRLSFLGLVPSEHSSGGRRQRGGITKTGNGHVRRVLVEAAWSYWFPARKTRTIQQRSEKTAEPVQAIASVTHSNTRRSR